MHPIDPSLVNSDLQLEITVVQGTKVTWLNSAPTSSYRIAVHDETTNELVYASAPISNSEAAEYTFMNTGRYVYSDPNSPDLKGIIHVVERDSIADNDSTDSSTKAVGLLVSGLEDKEKYDQTFSSGRYHIASSHVFFQDDALGSNSNSKPGNVLYIWTSDMPGI